MHIIYNLISIYLSIGLGCVLAFILLVFLALDKTTVKNFKGEQVHGIKAIPVVVFALSKTLLWWPGFIRMLLKATSKK